MADEIVYQLRITKQTVNPKYDPNKQDHYRSSDEREPFLFVTALEVTATGAQFNAIRKAVLEQF